MKMSWKDEKTSFLLIVSRLSMKTEEVKTKCRMDIWIKIHLGKRYKRFFFPDML